MKLSPMAFRLFLHVASRPSLRISEARELLREYTNSSINQLVSNDYVRKVGGSLKYSGKQPDGQMLIEIARLISPYIYDSISDGRRGFRIKILVVPWMCLDIELDSRNFWNIYIRKPQKCRGREIDEAIKYSDVCDLALRSDCRIPTNVRIYNGHGYN